MGRRSSRVLAAAAVLITIACEGSEPAGPPPPASALRFDMLDAGYYHTCGLTPAGSAWCWGGNAFGTLGDGSVADRTAPTRVAGTRTFSWLDAGAGHNCAVTASGSAWCWGQNDEGQLGDGTFTLRSSPVAVSGGHAFSRVSAGHAHSCGLTAQGAAWCWGDDSLGQLGDGGPALPGKSAQPVRVLFDEPFADIHAGYYQTCGVTTHAEVWCWGMNGAGQTGDGTTFDRHAPVAVAGDHQFTAIAPGDRFVCGVSGGVWCWGLNTHGQIGVNAPDTSLVPLAVEGTAALHDVRVSAGASTVAGTESYACGLRFDGRVFCWGGAIPALRERGAPAPLDDRIRAAVVAPGAQHVCVLSRDGFAYCGGANFAGQLGDGSRTARGPLIPVNGPGGA
ncbi:MAG TPA: hypothetical protein VK933_04495 [Longimicrobiales bacterium]|nr:hypothetical protein [Longimicrobiales bacterium]